VYHTTSGYETIKEYMPAEEGESNELSTESEENAKDDESDHECEYCEHYKAEKGNYVN
ncbi:480_t:CDS:2, partial [Dentiscutata erythropus]